MNLQRIIIQNFRSIENISFDFEKVIDDSYTYGLIGVNEAGKSSILKAIALKDSKQPITNKDFKDKSKNIEIEFIYSVEPEISDWYVENLSVTEDPVGNVKKWSRLRYKLTYSLSHPSAPVIEINLVSDNGKLKRSISADMLEDEEVQKCIFWTADEKYLISKPISLSAFSANPQGISIPLENCFLLSGYEDIKATISGIANDSTEQQYLQESLSQKVTEHIRAVWPNHPITISFHINGDVINFHIQDDGKGKAKTADQRSDGFKQFISFLLTISAENKNGVLSDTILLLDEPETHLHPQAQEYLLDELKKITRNNRNNLVIFATHSNYMIDKTHLNRNYKVYKNHDVTKLERLNGSISTYASVTFEVFDIPSTDYHNELYAKLHEAYQEESPDEKDRAFIKDFDTKFLHDKHHEKKSYPIKKEANAATLPTFVRNAIHHPDGGEKFTDKQLRDSITILRKIYLDL